MTIAVKTLRRSVFSANWPLDEEIRALSATSLSHSFLMNPSSHYLYIYLTQFVRALAEQHHRRPLEELSVLDWGCGKGHVSKLLRDLGSVRIQSCDVVSKSEDSAFGQETPILDHLALKVTPLEHEYILPYEDSNFDVVLSVGVLEHVPNDIASLNEIARVLKPNGLFFCFFLPTSLSWTQRLAHWRGDYYHNRLYNTALIKKMMRSANLELIDIWYRQLLPKNSVHYHPFRLFERFDQFFSEHTPLRHFSTNIEFVSVKPGSTRNPSPY